MRTSSHSEMASIQLPWVFIALSAVVFISTGARSTHGLANGYIEREHSNDAYYNNEIPSNSHGVVVVSLQPEGEYISEAISIEIINDELQLQLQQLVDNGILTPDELNIFVESNRIVDEIQQLMTQSDNSINKLEQLLIQKVTKWYKENGGSVSDVTQQIPSFFQESDIQEELKELVQREILNRRDIELFIASSSTISKLDEALERGNETVKRVYVLLGDRRALQQLNQN